MSKENVVNNSFRILRVTPLITLLRISAKKNDKTTVLHTEMRDNIRYERANERVMRSGVVGKMWDDGRSLRGGVKNEDKDRNIGWVVHVRLGGVKIGVSA